VLKTDISDGSTSKHILHPMTRPAKKAHLVF